MTDWVGHALKNDMTSLEHLGAGVEGDSATRFRALVRRHSIVVPQTFHLATPTFYGSSGRSRIDFVATHRSVKFSRIFVNFTAGRRRQLIPAAVPRDHMPLTMDLVTNGMRHSPDPTRGRWELETKIRNSSIVGLAATEATPDDPWENLVQRIQETAGPYLHQGAPRPARPLALERRRLLLKLGTARRLTGSSGDQCLVENAKTEITRVEKQMRRFSRWLLRRRRAMWLEELEEGIRKQDAFTVYRYASPRWHRHWVETPFFLQIRAYTPSQMERAQGLAKGPKGGLALHECAWNDFRREHLEFQDPGDSETTTLHREEARADYARTVKQLRRAPARRSCPPW